jgi:hypothetical protein
MSYKCNLLHLSKQGGGGIFLLLKNNSFVQETPPPYVYKYKVWGVYI